MALKLVETCKAGSIEGLGSPRCKRTFLTCSTTPDADNADDAIAAYDFVVANVASVWTYLSPAGSQRLYLVQVSDGERIAPGVFKFDCEYVAEDLNINVAAIRQIPATKPNGVPNAQPLN